MISEFTDTRGALRRRAMAQAIVQRGFEAVKVFARQIRCLVDHDARHALARGGTHHAGFAMVNLKALFQRDGGDVCLEGV